MMKCNNCDSGMEMVYDMDHYVCQSCNKFVFQTTMEESEEPIVPSGKTVEFACPACEGINLQVGHLLETEVCFCENCRGYMLSAPQLGELVELLRGAYQGPDDEPVMMDARELERRKCCPACFRRMDTHPYYGPGNVVIDSCLKCHFIWLDHGELAKIVRAPGRRNKKSFAPESETLKAAFNAQAHNNAGGFML